MKKTIHRQAKLLLMVLFALCVAGCEKPAHVQRQPVATEVQSPLVALAPPVALASPVLASPMISASPTTLQSSSSSMCKRSFVCKSFSDDEGEKLLIAWQMRHINEAYQALGFLIKVFSEGNILTSLDERVEYCAGDSHAVIIEDSLSLTDLDANGIGEISFVYNLHCMDNLTPAAMGLAMFESRAIYRIRGNRKLFIEANGDVREEEALSFAIDKSFIQAQPVHLDFAEALWGRYLFDDSLGGLDENRQRLLQEALATIHQEVERFQRSEMTHGSKK